MEAFGAVLNQMPRHIVLPAAFRQAMLDHVSSCYPEEACGLLGGQAAGVGCRVAAVLPVENALHSPVRYRMEPSAQLQGFLRLEEQGLDLVGIYHSHPTGPDHPSQTDLDEFAYPGVLALIWSPDGRPGSGDSWQLKAFWIEKQLNSHKVAQVPIQTPDESAGVN